MNKNETNFPINERVCLELVSQSGMPALPEGCDSRLIHTERNIYVLRQPKPSAKMQSIYDEYAGIGFTTRFGGTLSLRSAEEQCVFIANCWALDLPVVSPAAVTEDGIIFPFIKGVVLPRVLGFGSQEALIYVVKENLKDIQRAHALGIVYGDRWGPNDIISPEGIRRIDMDLQIAGPYAREFELAQALYHMVYWAKDNMRKSVVLDVITSELSSLNNQYNTEVLKEFLIGHYQYFMGTEFESLDGYQ